MMFEFCMHISFVYFLSIATLGLDFIFFQSIYDILCSCSYLFIIFLININYLYLNRKNPGGLEIIFFTNAIPSFIEVLNIWITKLLEVNYLSPTFYPISVFWQKTYS